MNQTTREVVGMAAELPLSWTEKVLATGRVGIALGVFDDLEASAGPGEAFDAALLVSNLKVLLAPGTDGGVSRSPIAIKVDVPGMSERAFSPAYVALYEAAEAIEHALLSLDYNEVQAIADLTLVAHAIAFLDRTFSQLRLVEAFLDYRNGRFEAWQVKLGVA